MSQRTRPLALAALIILLFPATASAAIRITEISFDPSGRDTGSNSHLNQEYVVLKNTGPQAQQLSGWVLKDRNTGGHRYEFPRLRLGVGKNVRIHTGSGKNDRNDLYWGWNWYIWNNTGDTATLKQPDGTRVDRCNYGSSASSPYRC
jgi:hypothetical protein